MGEGVADGDRTGGAEAEREVAGSASPPTHRPLVWLLLAEKRGDEGQIRFLARRLAEAVAADREGRRAARPTSGHESGSLGPLRFVEKRLTVLPAWRDAKPRIRPSLAAIDLAASDPLEAPWPDLVLTAGRRLASVALFIKRASRGRARVVLVGKPRERIADFDLIAAAAHYVFPPPLGSRGAAMREWLGRFRGAAAETRPVPANRSADPPNVVRHGLPMMEVDPVALAEAKKAWVGRLLLLPRPLTALFVGGPTGGLRFDVATIEAVMEGAERVVSATRGSLYVTTSRRTPPAVADWLRLHCSASVQLHLYDAAQTAATNPYSGLLALAENFVVTSDSLSMMVDVARLGRPLRIHPLAPRDAPVERLLQRLGLIRASDPRRDPIPAGGLGPRLLAKLGWPIHSRDLAAIARALVAADHARWLDDPVDPAFRPAPYRDPAIDQVVARVRALLD